MKTIFPAHGWLPPGAHFQLKWDDQGRDFATLWKGAIQAPGNGEVLGILADQPFPNGFGPHYAVVRIDSGPWAGHEYYIGHCTAVVAAGQRFSFGHVLAHADQGENWASTVGGWVELGEAFNGLPGPKESSHWFDKLIATPLVIESPDRVLAFGDEGMRVLGMSSRLRDCGYLSRPFWHFNRQVHGALVKFKLHHNLAVNHGVLDPHADLVLSHSAQACKKTHKKEV